MKCTWESLGKGTHREKEGTQPAIRSLKFLKRVFLKNDYQMWTLLSIILGENRLHICPLLRALISSTCFSKGKRDQMSVKLDT